MQNTTFETANRARNIALIITGNPFAYVIYLTMPGLHVSNRGLGGEGGEVTTTTARMLAVSGQ